MTPTPSPTPLLLNLGIRPSDFRELLSNYHDDGLAKPIGNAIASAFARSLSTQFDDDLVKVEVKLSCGRNVTHRSILEAGGLSVFLHKLSVDLKKSSRPRAVGLDLPSGIKEGSLDWDGTFASRPVKFVFKDMAARDRYLIRTSSLFVSANLFGFNWSDVDDCACPKHLLRPLRDHRHSKNYMLWACACCGSQYFCECIRGVPEYYAERPGYVVDEAQQLLRESQYRDGICHFCRDLPSSVVYISKMYGASQIKSNYHPYINEVMVQQGLDVREAENIIRERLGVPRIGEGWVSETQLYNTIRMLYPTYDIQREASPQWLGRQRFDVFLPSAGVAIEYQGEQHFMAVERFGGEHALRQTQERDREKWRKAHEAGVIVVEFSYDEDLNEEVIKQRIDAAIERQKKS